MRHKQPKLFASVAIAANCLFGLSGAHAQGLGTIVGSMMETHIGVGAAASLVAAHPTSTVSDLDAAWWAASSPVVGGMTYDGATVVLPDSPGLGIEELA